MKLTQDTIDNLPKDFFKGMDLSYGNFEGLILHNFIFFQSKMEGVNFSNCSLVNSKFYYSDLTGIIFEKTDLTYCSFYHCYIGNIDFTTAFSISYVNFGGSSINNKTVGLPKYINLKILSNHEYNFNKNRIGILNSAI